MRALRVGGMGLVTALAAAALGGLGFAVIEQPVRARRHYSGVLIEGGRTWLTVSRPLESKRGKRRRLQREARAAK